MTKTVESLWEEYLSKGPTNHDLQWIFFGSHEGALKDAAWEELRKREDVDNEGILFALLYCNHSEQVRKDAWEMLLKRNPSNEEMERIVSRLGIDHPISLEAKKLLGRGKSEILEEIDNCFS